MIEFIGRLNSTFAQDIRYVICANKTCSLCQYQIQQYYPDCTHVHFKWVEKWMVKVLTLAPISPRQGPWWQRLTRKRMMGEFMRRAEMERCSTCVDSVQIVCRQCVDSQWMERCSTGRLAAVRTLLNRRHSTQINTLKGTYGKKMLGCYRYCQIQESLNFDIEYSTQSLANHQKRRWTQLD